MTTADNQMSTSPKTAGGPASGRMPALRRLSTVAETLRRSPGSQASQPAIDEVYASLDCALIALYRLDDHAFVLEATSHEGTVEPPLGRMAREDGLQQPSDPEELRLVLEGSLGEPVGLLVVVINAPPSDEDSQLIDVFVELLSAHLCRQATDTKLLRTSARLARLNDLSRTLGTHHDIAGLLAAAAEGLRELIGGGDMAVYLIQGGTPILAASHESSTPFPESIQLATADGTPILGQPGAPEVQVGESNLEGRNIMVELLRGSHGISGALLLRLEDPTFIEDAESRSFLSALASHLGIAVHNTFLMEEIRHQAIFDDLTGLAGRRHFMTELNREITRARREHGPLALLMLDADHFKELNDTYGHPAGDAVLVGISKTLVVGTRSIDVVGRLGGEEMGVILPGATAQVATLVAERLRASVQALEIPWGEDILKVTVSVGVGIWTQRLQAEDLIVEADQALYQAKNLGRDLVVTQPSIETLDAS